MLVLFLFILNHWPTARQRPPLNPFRYPFEEPPCTSPVVLPTFSRHQFKQPFFYRLWSPFLMTTFTSLIFVGSLWSLRYNKNKNLFGNAIKISSHIKKANSGSNETVCLIRTSLNVAFCKYPDDYWSVCQKTMKIKLIVCLGTTQYISSRHANFIT